MSVPHMREGEWTTCTWCFGSGFDDAEWDDRCRACGGTGEQWTWFEDEEDDDLDEAAAFAAGEVTR